jgi:ketosteroid isomerase-like protein
MPLKAGGSDDQTYHWVFRFRGYQIVEVLEFVEILAA